MNSENRRSFVKKSLATSVSISFTGLIRARGEEGNGASTTSDPWGETSTVPITDETAGTWATTISTEQSTSPWIEETTTEQQTTTQDYPLTRSYTLNIYVKSVTPKEGGGYTAVFTKNAAEAMIFSGTQPAFSTPQITGSPDENGGHGSLKFGDIEMPDGVGDDQEDEGTATLDSQVNPNPKVEAHVDDGNLPSGQTKIFFTGQVFYRWPTSGQ